MKKTKHTTQEFRQIKYMSCPHNRDTLGRPIGKIDSIDEYKAKKSVTDPQTNKQTSWQTEGDNQAYALVLYLVGLLYSLLSVRVLRCMLSLKLLRT